MLPRALIGDIKPENWLGFIDAIYAIILTLLLIELPSAILELIKEYEGHPSLHWALLNGFSLSVLGYLSMFIIIYDVWAHHRVIIVEAALSRINLSLGILILFLSSLLPPIYHVLSVLKYESLTSLIKLTGTNATIYLDARIALYLIGFGIHGCIALIASKDLKVFRRLGGIANSRIIALKRLKESSIAMIVVMAVVSILSFTNWLQPPLPLVLIALSTHLPVDRLLLNMKRRMTTGSH